MQHFLEVPSRWTLSLSDEFDLLGPFPIAAREQYHLSPGFPLQDIDQPYLHQENRTYLSSLVDNGIVHWDRHVTESPGSYNIAYPSVRWDSIRSVIGWAGLQHHSLIHTTITITPSMLGVPDDSPTLRILLEQASAIALIPRFSSITDSPVQWLLGDIYAQSSLPRIIPLPAGLPRDQPTIFDVLISSDYEIRLFGDPMFSEGRPEPVSRIKLDIQLTSTGDLQFGEKHLIPDVMDGRLQGDVLGIEIRAGSTSQSIIGVSCTQPGLHVSIPDAFRVAPFQTRLLPVLIKQSFNLNPPVDHLPLILHLDSSTQHQVNVLLKHIAHWTSATSEDFVIRQTHMTPILSESLLLPPTENTPNTNRPVLLALHGAGVDVLSPWWYQSLPRQKRAWTVLPGGLTSWGYDWRGPSAIDAFSAIDALKSREQGISDKVTVLGHSNGGQGAFYIASRYPDRVPNAIPLAAYLSASAYVPTSFAHGFHFADPILQGLLKASTAGEDNDLFLGNLARSRVRIFHGGHDENVPVWQSRKSMEIIRAWAPNADVSFDEIPGKPHWWDGALRTLSVQQAAHELLQSEVDIQSKSFFTLTIMWPGDSGAMNGWRIYETEIPGRLARVIVQGSNVRTTNVWSFSVDIRVNSYLLQSFTLDGTPIELLAETTTDVVWFSRSDDRLWKQTIPYKSQLTGPISRILGAGSPIILIVPATLSSTTGKNQPTRNHFLSMASRLAHDLFVYLRLDTVILTDTEALAKDRDWETEPSIVFGGPHQNTYAEAILSNKANPFSFPSNVSFSIAGRKFDTPDTGLLFMRDSCLFICGTDAVGYDRALRAFPVRTGIPNPEWMILGPEADVRGSGGILGAGFWGRQGVYNPQMSWLG